MHDIQKLRDDQVRYVAGSLMMRSTHEEMMGFLDEADAEGIKALRHLVIEELLRREDLEWEWPKYHEHYAPPCPPNPMNCPACAAGIPKKPLHMMLGRN